MSLILTLLNSSHPLQTILLYWYLLCTKWKMLMGTGPLLPQKEGRDSFQPNIIGLCVISGKFLTKNIIFLEKNHLKTFSSLNLKISPNFHSSGSASVADGSCACEGVLYDIHMTVLLHWAVVPPRYCCESSSWEKPEVSEILTNSLNISKVRRLISSDTPRAWLSKYSRVSWQCPFITSHMGREATFFHRSMLDNSGSRSAPAIEKDGLSTWSDVHHPV